MSDVNERRRSSDPRPRQAIARSTNRWATVGHGKRGRAIPLDEDAVAAITAWVKTRPAAATEHRCSDCHAPAKRQPLPLHLRI